jgi:PAS domain S-box-containing protein
MELDTTTRLNRWVKSAEAKTLHGGRLPIGPRLILGFAFIILSMLAADAIILWQFHEVRIQAGRLNDIDQRLVAVLRVHTSMLLFHDRLDQFADDEDADRLVKEAGPLRAAVLEDIRRATSILNLPPFDPRRDPTILPTLHVIQSALLSELEAITTLAESGDWRAVHLRLTHEVRPLESLTSDLVEKVDREVGEQQAQTVRNIRRVQHLVFMIVPLTAVLTLLIAATLGLAITRSITKPLARLVEGSKALARGQFQHQVSVSGKDELAELGQVFNDTARRLRDLYATLQSSEDRLRLVIDTIPTFAWTALPDGSEDFVNRHWHEYSGLSAKESVGSGWEAAVHPTDLKQHLEKWRASLASGEPFENEVRYRRAADGQYRWFLARAVPLRDQRGKILKWYGISTDIEDRKRAEEERERLRADLAHVNRVSMLGELAASVSHELKQPIAAAMTNAKTCVRWLKRDQPSLEEATAAAMRIVNDGSRATEIIERLRSLYKKDLPQRELVEVNEIIREMIELLRAEANQYAVSIRTNLVADLPKITADGVQLQQVFMNLILNAIEAMKETGGVLTVKTQLGEDGQLLISVSDSGVGLPKEKTEQIFDAFFTTKPQGSGMGLSISRSIVESHGGRLWATANNGRGATFHFTLPTAAETCKGPQPERDSVSLGLPLDDADRGQGKPYRKK